MQRTRKARLLRICPAVISAPRCVHLCNHRQLNFFEALWGEEMYWEIERWFVFRLLLRTLQTLTKFFTQYFAFVHRAVSCEVAQNFQIAGTNNHVWTSFPYYTSSERAEIISELCACKFFFSHSVAIMTATDIKKLNDKFRKAMATSNSWLTYALLRFERIPAEMLEKWIAESEAGTNSLETPLIIDARRTDEWEHSHLPGAINLYTWNKRNKMQFLKKTHRGQLIVVYCGLGLRSGNGPHRLEERKRRKKMTVSFATITRYLSKMVAIKRLSAGLCPKRWLLWLGEFEQMLLCINGCVDPSRTLACEDRAEERADRWTSRPDGESKKEAPFLVVCTNYPTPLFKHY